MATITMEEWAAQLQKFLFDTLANVEPDPEKRKRYVSSKAMPTWIKAFTHQTFDPVNNYEELEFIGDKVLSLIFGDYNTRRFSGLTKDQLTELNSHYLSTEYLPNFSKSLGFNRWVLIKDVSFAGSRIQEDIFEAYFGALYKIGNDIGLGLGHNLCYKMAKGFFDSIDIDLKLAGGHATMKIPQMFQRLNLDPIQENATDNESYVTVTLSITNTTLRELQDMGIPITGGIIGVGNGGTSTVARNNAYNQARKILDSYGMTEGWVQDVKTVKEFTNPELIPYVTGARNKARELGYDLIYFEIPRNTRTRKDMVIQLMGENTQTRALKILASMNVPEWEALRGKKELLMKLN